MRRTGEHQQCPMHLENEQGDIMAVRKIIEIDEEKCTGCGNCIVDCAEGALEIIDGKARVVNEVFCDGLGACIQSCPEGALKIIEREAREFDEKAVEEHLKNNQPQQPTLACGCPGSLNRDISREECSDPEPKYDTPARSHLENWPVQLHLVNPDAPYFKGARLLLIADCTAYAYANVHADFIKGRKTIIFCPKLDDVSEYVDKLARILQTQDIKDITWVRMKVPCCGGTRKIIQEAMKMANTVVPWHEIIVSVEGKIIK